MQSYAEFFESLFRQPAAASGNKILLQEVTETYPFFAPAQFYLLAHTEKDENTYSHQAAKTALLFNNPYWLNFQLVQARNESPAGRPQPAIKPETVPAPTETFKPVLTLEPATSNNLIFQPLYTTDYFASQGIKLSEEINPGDRLGLQLKSFTEWLKTMKKIHPDKLPQSDRHSDEKIQYLAEQSNSEQEVVTEAMADVLVQQQHLSRAIEVYEKLSLLNPAKSAYFAARIKQLKGS